MLEKYYNKKTNTLTIPLNFNEELKDLPSDTKIIIFEEDYNKREYSQFNQLVDKLPNNLTHLTFGCYFDKLVNNLPNFLKNLTFGDNFNQKVDNLPNILIYLTFGYCFNEKVDNLPNNLKQLKIFETPVYYLKKIPFGCRIIDEDDNEIFI